MKKGKPTRRRRQAKRRQYPAQPTKVREYLDHLAELCEFRKDYTAPMPLI